MRKLLTIAALALLCGCATPFQASDSATCQNVGTVPGSEKYTNCMVLLLQARDGRGLEVLRAAGYPVSTHQ